MFSSCQSPWTVITDIVSVRAINNLLEPIFLRVGNEILVSVNFTEVTTISRVGQIAFILDFMAFNENGSRSDVMGEFSGLVFFLGG